MSGRFCHHDWHQTTEEDIQQMMDGEDAFYWADVRSTERRYEMARLREQNRRPYAIHDIAIATAKSEGLAFHLLPQAEQDARWEAAEAVLAAQPPLNNGKEERA